VGWQIALIDLDVVDICPLGELSCFESPGLPPIPTATATTMATRIIDDTPIIANFFFPALEPSLLIAIFFNEVINVLSTKLRP
jgi:hypothetical protein